MVGGEEGFCGQKICLRKRIIKNSIPGRLSVYCWCICWRMNLFQDWMIRGTELRVIVFASEKIRPSAEASGMVRSARKKFAG